jgi:hypothetical protein
MTNSLAASYFQKAEREMIDLKLFWDSLTWWERDISLTAIFDYLFELRDINEYKTRCQLITDMAEEYAFENESNYPTDEELGNDMDNDLTPRLPQHLCVPLIQSFSPEDIAELAQYMGVEADEPLEVLLTLNNRSMSAYYALRNRIGTIVKGQIQQAHS